MRDFMSITDFSRVAFISTRIAGTDGVSLEIEKWADVFEQEGFTCYYFAGELDRPQAVSCLVPEAHFRHPDIKDVYLQSFGTTLRHRAISKKIYQLAIKLKDDLYDFVDKYDIHIIIAENALTIPLNIPLGIALTEFIAETNIHTIAHHHDFYWERDRFMINAVHKHGLSARFAVHSSHGHKFSCRFSIKPKDGSISACRSQCHGFRESAAAPG